MVGFLVGGLTVNIGYWDVYYFLLVALVALERLVLAERQAPVADDPPDTTRLRYAGGNSD
jgi:hypothetical protein